MLCRITLLSPATGESIEMYKGKLLKIGDLAQLSGVPVKTIRHYSDIGVLPPSDTTEAGFRLYSKADWARLELIRTLREADFSLPAIKELLQNKREVSTVLTLQLGAIEENIRNLQRQQTLIRLALHQGDEGALTYLSHARALTHLDAAGRKHFLDKHLNRALEEVPAESDWKAKLWLWQDGMLELPEEIDGNKFGAWIELAELVLDESFSQRLNEMAKSSWAYQKGRDGIEEWRTGRNQVLTDALKAAQQGELPQGRHCQILVQRYIDVNAAFMKRTDAPTFPRYLLDLIEGIADPRFQRYWELIGILKGRSPETMWCKYQARGWLVEGLKWRLESSHAGSTTDRAVVWRVADGRIVAEPTGMYGALQDSALSWHPDGRTLAYGADMGVRLWDVPHNRLAARLPGFAPYARLLDVTPDGRTLAVGSFSGLRLWDVLNGKLLGEIGDDDFRAARFTPDGKQLLAVREQGYQGEPSAKGRVFIERYDALRGELLASVETTIEGSHGAAFSPDRRFVAVARDNFADPDDEGVVDVFALPPGKRLASLRHVGRIRGDFFGKPITLGALAFSRDGARLAVSTVQGVIWLWEVPSGRLMKRLPVYKTAPDEYGVEAIAWSPDGTRLLVGAQIYDVTSGQLLHTLHKQRVLGGYSVDWSADGQRILVARAGGDVNKLTVWRVGTGDRPKLASTADLKYSVYGARFGPRGGVFLEHWLEGLIGRRTFRGGSK